MLVILQLAQRTSTLDKATLMVCLRLKKGEILRIYTPAHDSCHHRVEEGSSCYTYIFIQFKSITCGKDNISDKRRMDLFKFVPKRIQVFWKEFLRFVLYVTISFWRWNDVLSAIFYAFCTDTVCVCVCCYLLHTMMSLAEGFRVKWV